MAEERREEQQRRSKTSGAVIIVIVGVASVLLCLCSGFWLFVGGA